MEATTKGAERREKAKALARQLAAMDDAQRQSLIDRIGAVLTIEKHALSFKNTLILAIQCPTATVVGGYRQWQAAGRQVRKGEHGLMIWVPSVRKTKDTENGEGEEDGEVRFLTATVFDIAQTVEITESEVAA